MKNTWAAILYGSLTIHLLWAQLPVSCPSDWFLSAVTPGRGTTLYSISPNSPFPIATQSASSPVLLDIIGHSVADGFLYGLDSDARTLYRIDGKGTISLVDTAINLPLDYEYRAGTMTPDGRSLLVAARSKKTGFDERFYSIPIRNPRARNGSIAIAGNDPVTLEDFAFSPTSGLAFGFDRQSKKLAFIGPQNGVVTTYAYLGNQAAESIGAVFFDQEGNMFGIGKNKGGGANNTLFRINPLSGEIRAVQTLGIEGEQVDGCSCPFTFRMEKQIKPAVVLPCSELEITYTITNHAGIGYGFLTLRDTLPEGFTIESILKNTMLSTWDSAAIPSIFALDKSILTIGENTVRIRVRVDELQSASYFSKASFTPLPNTLGSKLLSNNAGPIVDDQLLSVSLGPDRSICFGETLTLSAPAVPYPLQWSDGSTGRELSVNRSGLYSLEIQTECVLVKDSVFIKVAERPLSVDLGKDTTLSWGESVPLSYVSNAMDPVQYTWIATRPEELSCNDCPGPLLTPNDSSTIVLEIQDATGCTARDTLMVFVDNTREVEIPNIFTPNGDGINDYFYVRSILGSNIIVESLRVFDRWGKVVHTTQKVPNVQKAKLWDGKDRLRLSPTGLYYWEIRLQYPDGLLLERRGNIMLVR